MNTSHPSSDSRHAIDRRSLVSAGLGFGVAMGAAAGFSIAGPALAAEETLKPSMVPLPLPPQVPAKEGQAEVGGKHLYYWDTGGTGTPIVLVHPASGSAFIWSYQQPVFAKAGHRVIAYSRANYRNSDPTPQDNPGTSSGDLGGLMNVLGVRKFHAVASASGCSTVLDFALTHSEQLYSMVLSSGAYGGISEPDYRKAVALLKVKGYDEMPTYFKELGPSYRVANPEGTKAWAELEEHAKTGKGPDQGSAAAATWASLAALKVPALLIAGDSDLNAPPSLMRMVASHMPGSKFLAVPETGHSVYWEQSAIFNRAVLDFVGRHKG